MAERRENSVLFSLRELRTIEEDRVRGEEEAERQRIESERHAREEEVRRAREAEEAKVRAEQDRVRQEQNDRERVVREEQLRLQESERRAQIDAASRLEQARIEAEARARVDGKKFPMGAVVGGIGALVLLAAVVMGILVSNHNEELRRSQAEAQARFDADSKRLKAESDERAGQLKKELDSLQGQIEKTHDEAEKAKIRARIQEMNQRSAPTRAVSKPSRSSEDKQEKAPKKLKVDTTDPLGGLPGL